MLCCSSADQYILLHKHKYIHRIIEYPHVSYSFVLLKEILWEGSYLLPYVNGILTLYKYTQDIGVPACQLSVCVVKRDSTGG